eukprot:719014-Rhodomonas_salina.1
MPPPPPPAPLPSPSEGTAPPGGFEGGGGSEVGPAVPPGCTSAPPSPPSVNRRISTLPSAKGRGGERTESWWARGRGGSKGCRGGGGGRRCW